jgi:ribosomal protein L3 glutamine methyltransferase
MMRRPPSRTETPAQAGISMSGLIDELAEQLARSGIWFDVHATGGAYEEACQLVLWSQDLSPETLDDAGRIQVDPAAQARARHAVAERIRRRVPIAYLTQEAWVQGVPFHVDERCAVPRSHIAELIVSGSLDTWLDQRARHVLDLGTGNGNLAVLAAMMWPWLKIDASDLSHDALEVARLNLQRHALSDPITLIRSKGLEHVRGPYDLILCNPPRIGQAEYAQLPAELLAEPRLALYGGSADGMEFIRQLLAQVQSVLTPQGALVLEIGHSRMAFESAFPGLKVLWLHTQAGFEQVVLISQDALTRWRSQPETTRTPMPASPDAAEGAEGPQPATPAGSTLIALIDAMASRLHHAGVHFGHGTSNAFDEATWLTLWALNKPLNELDHLADMLIAPEQAARVRQIISERIERRVPAAYMTREAWLQGVPFYVDERVIVPRSFIAELIAHGSFDAWLSAQTHRVLDLCTGNGSLAVLSGLFWPEVQIDASDLSHDALEVARINVQRHGLSDRITLIESNGLAAVQGPYDLILCNPPYVNSAAMARLPNEYHAEPVIALDGGTDGMDFVRALIHGLDEVLSSIGVLVLEIGNERSYFEQAFPGLEAIWLETSAGHDQVLLLTRQAVTTWRSPT